GRRAAIARAHALGELAEERRVPLGVVRVAAHPVGEADLLARLGVQPQALLVAHDLAALADEAEPDSAPPRRPGEADLGQAAAEVEEHEGRVLDAIGAVLERPHRRLHRLRLAEDRAALIE